MIWIMTIGFFFLGALLGVLFMALLNLASDADDRQQREIKEFIRDLTDNNRSGNS
jgi:uncharacterized membrane-anchored protein YhcB (DUF1043 family)